MIPHRFSAPMLDQIVFCMQNKVADLKNRCVISLDGQINAERMKEAMRLTLDAEPILGCRFVDHWWHPYWKRNDDIDQTTLSSLVTVTNSSQDITAFMSRPIDSSRDPLVQTLIHRADTDTLYIKIDHTVADGCGAKEYIYLLASIYRKLTDDHDYVPTPNLSGSRSLRQISRRLGFVDKLRIIRSGVRDYKRRVFPPRYWSFPSRAAIPSNSIVVIRQFSPQRFRTIKEYGRQHQATLNEIMLAAFCRALFDVIGPDPHVPLRLATTINLRRYLPPERTWGICNLSNFFFINIGCSLGATFEDTTLKIKKDVHAMKTDFIGLGDYPLVAICFKVLPFSCTRRLFNSLALQPLKTGNAPPVFSNVGSIDAEQLSFIDAHVTEAYFIGAAFKPPFFGAALSSFREALTLSISFFETAINKSDVNHFLDRIDYELPR